MVFKQGNTYQLKAKVDTDLSLISKIVFQFNEVRKVYQTSGERFIFGYTKRHKLWYNI